MLHHKTHSEAYTKPNPTKTTTKSFLGDLSIDLIIDLLIHHSAGQRIHMT